MMTEIPKRLINEWLLLRNLWYRKILPKDKLKLFKAFTWKVAGINVGEFQQLPILLTRVSDKTPLNIGYNHIHKEFVTKDDYIEFAKQNNYELKAESDSELVFELKDFDS